MDLDGFHCLGDNGTTAVSAGPTAEVGPVSRVSGPAGGASRCRVGLNHATAVSSELDHQSANFNPAGAAMN